MVLIALILSSVAILLSLLALWVSWDAFVWISSAKAIAENSRRVDKSH